ncbi:MAG: mannosyltransferase family protein [Bryobacteraceae bacterium]
MSRLTGTAKALAIFGVSRIVALMGLAFSGSYIKENTLPGLWNAGAPWWRYLLRYDSAYYLAIAADGYDYNGDPSRMQDVAFFPGYPLLVRWAARMLRLSVPFSAIFVSNLCAAGAIALLFWLAARLWDEDTGLATVAAVSLFPASFFLSAAYAESAALLFSLAAFLLLFRGRIAFAALCAGCASGIRPLGFLLAIPLVYSVWSRADRRFSLRFLGYACAVSATACSGMIAYGLYCWIRFRDPLLFVHAHAAWNFEGGGLGPGQAAWRQLTAPLPLHYLPNSSDPWFFLAFAAIAIAVWKRLPMELNLYTAASFLALLATRVFGGPGFISMNRYLLALFPCMMGMALIAVRRAWLMASVAAVFGAMLFMHAALFARWYWAG